MKNRKVLAQLIPYWRRVILLIQTQSYEKESRI